MNKPTNPKSPAPDVPKHSPEELEEAIVQVAAAAKKLLSSRLTNRAIVVLIQDMIPAAKRPTREQIADVLSSAADLEKHFLKKRGQP